MKMTFVSSTSSEEDEAMSTTKEEITGLSVKYQVRCLNVYRKLFFDLQERDVSPEIRDRAASLVRAVKADDYKEAYSQADAIDYLFNMLYKTGYIIDEQYKSIAIEGKVLIEEINQMLSGNDGENETKPNNEENKEG